MLLSLVCYYLLFIEGSDCAGLGGVSGPQIDARQEVIDSILVIQLVEQPAGHLPEQFKFCVPAG
ncbi:hypothetical protein ASF00_09220 [Sphingomonas sp. Leaf34]|nr:hypothetical protein ASF00_09220 [Sphingomonas sp. Leaf34]